MVHSGNIRACLYFTDQIGDPADGPPYVNEGVCLFRIRWWKVVEERVAGIKRDDLATLSQHIPADAPQEFEAFLNLHRMILDDSALSQAPKELIRERRSNAEWALVQQMEQLTDRFDEIDDPYLRERKADVQQAVERVLKALMGAQTLAEPELSEEQEMIVVAHDLSPADIHRVRHAGTAPAK